jgi:hypothetical protein
VRWGVKEAGEWGSAIACTAVIGGRAYASQCRPRLKWGVFIIILKPLEQVDRGCNIF